MPHKFYTTIISALFLFCFANITYAQQVSGTVTDQSTGKVLVGVNILVKGTSNGTVTDDDGHYNLNVSSLQDSLRFSYIGFQTRTVPINGRTTIDIALNPKVISGKQLVVVGYGTQQRNTITGSVSEIQGSEITQAPVAHVSQSLSGNVAGISMLPHSGQPGHNSPDIHIRGLGTIGNSNPLIVINGIERDNLNDIDPASIASITVLKDAAAVAPYGVGGANGVIVIKTKSGQAGKTNISFHTDFGIATPLYVANTLTAKDFMRLSNEAYLNANPDGEHLPFKKDLIANYRQLHAKNPDKYPISNNAVKKFADLHTPRSNSTIQVSGGSQNINYYAELGYNSQGGMFPQVKYHRYSYNVRLNAYATPTTQVHLSVIGSVSKTGNIDAARGTGQLFRAGYKFRPTKSLFYSNGLWGLDSGDSPVAVLRSGGYQHNHQNVLMTKIMLEQKLFKGLSAKLAFAYDPSHTFIKNLHRPYYYYTQDLSTNPPTYTKVIGNSENGAPTYSYLNESYARAQRFTYQAYLNYKRDFGKNHVTGLLVAEAHKNKYNNLSAGRTHFAINSDQLNLGPSNKDYYSNGGADSTSTRLGFVYKVGYNYSGKYLIQVSGRYDGSYYFAPDQRWGFFPAVSAGWVLSREKFIKLPSFIDFLKIRGSWGKAGNLAGSAYQFLEGYNVVGDDYAFGNGTLVQGSYIPQEANPDITWEVSTKIDIGLNARLLDDLLSFDFDYFHQKRTGMLLPPAVTVPIAYGLQLAKQNAGVMDSHGFEATINFNSRTLGNGWHFGFRGTFSYAKNKMVQIFETPATFNNPHRRRTGRAYNTPFGLHAIGLFTTADDKNGDGIIDGKDGYNIKQFGTLHPGDIKYQDVNRDGEIDQGDYVPIGHPMYPEITYGFTPTVSWKGVNLSLFFQGSAISSINTQGFLTVPFNNNGSNTVYNYYDHRWTPEHQNARYPRVTPAPTTNNTQPSDLYMVNTGYLRLKTATLSYTLPVNISEKIGAKSVKIFFTGENLFTVSNLSFMDPQAIKATSGSQTSSSNGNVSVAYPLHKIYSGGITIDF